MPEGWAHTSKTPCLFWDPEWLWNCVLPATAAPPNNGNPWSMTQRECCQWRLFSFADKEQFVQWWCWTGVWHMQMQGSEGALWCTDVAWPTRVTRRYNKVLLQYKLGTWINIISYLYDIRIICYNCNNLAPIQPHLISSSLKDLP